MLRIFFACLYRQDHSVAGTLGDVEWLTTEADASRSTCVIRTDDANTLMSRLDADDNVSSWEEVIEGDDRGSFIWPNL